MTDRIIHIYIQEDVKSEKENVFQCIYLFLIREERYEGDVLAKIDGVVGLGFY